MADDSNQDEPFLQRWARRKADAAQVETDNSADNGAPVVETASLAGSPPARADDQLAADGEEKEATEIDPSTLPDVDSLEADSDFSIFMQDGVPEELQKRALQRLWRLDPSFGHIDGLLEYGEDFTGNGLVAEAVNTVYKVGKGMVSEDDVEEEETQSPDIKTQPPSSEDMTEDDDGAVAALTEETPVPEVESGNESDDDAVAVDAATRPDGGSKS